MNPKRCGNCAFWLSAVKHTPCALPGKHSEPIINKPKRLGDWRVIPRGRTDPACEKWVAATWGSR